jgi:hypothetical protein
MLLLAGGWGEEESVGRVKEEEEDERDEEAEAGGRERGRRDRAR